MIISRRTFFLIAGLVVLAVVIVVVWWLARSPKTDRQQIVELLSRTERAVEHKDLGGTMRAISKDYADGTYSKGERCGAQWSPDFARSALSELLRLCISWKLPGSMPAPNSMLMYG